MKDEYVATPASHDAARAQAYARAIVHLLGTGRVLSACSACAVVIAAVALAQSMASGGALDTARAWGLWSVALTGVASAWYAWRVRLDEGLFADLAGAISAHSSPDAALASLDAALVSLGLVTADQNALNPLHSRGRGARRLLVAQAAIAALQAMATLVLLMPIAR